MVDCSLCIMAVSSSAVWSDVIEKKIEFKLPHSNQLINLGPLGLEQSKCPYSNLVN